MRQNQIIYGKEPTYCQFIVSIFMIADFFFAISDIDIDEVINIYHIIWYLLIHNWFVYIISLKQRSTYMQTFIHEKQAVGFFFWITFPPSFWLYIRLFSCLPNEMVVNIFTIVSMTQCYQIKDSVVVALSLPVTENRASEGKLMHIEGPAIAGCIKKTTSGYVRMFRNKPKSVH